MNKRPPTIPPVPPRCTRAGDAWRTHKARARAQRRAKRQETTNV